MFFEAVKNDVMALELVPNQFKTKEFFNMLKLHYKDAMKIDEKGIMFIYENGSSVILKDEYYKSQEENLKNDYVQELVLGSSQIDYVEDSSQSNYYSENGFRD
jgi:hypothetical protein